MTSLSAPAWTPRAKSVEPNEPRGASCKRAGASDPGAPKFCATCLASSAEKAALDLGVGTPYCTEGSAARTGQERSDTEMRSAGERASRQTSLSRFIDRYSWIDRLRRWLPATAEGCTGWTRAFTRRDGAREREGQLQLGEARGARICHPSSGGSRRDRSRTLRALARVAVRRQDENMAREGWEGGKRQLGELLGRAVRGRAPTTPLNSEGLWLLALNTTWPLGAITRALCRPSLFLFFLSRASWRRFTCPLSGTPAGQAASLDTFSSALCSVLPEHHGAAGPVRPLARPPVDSSTRQP